MPTKIPANVDHMGKTACAQCGDGIDAADYRVVVKAVEKQPPDYKQTSSRGPGDSVSRAFCGVCVAEVSNFSLPNPWKPVVDPANTSGPHKADLEANLLTTNSPSRPAPESTGEASQRAHLLQFLNDPRAMAMRSDMREVARMWAEGASLNELARKLGKDQSTISRIIQGARKMSYANG